MWNALAIIITTVVVCLFIVGIIFYANHRVDNQKPKKWYDKE